MGKIITVTNTKGGVGKTTTVIYLATILSSYGKVLVKDSDPQGSCSEWLDGIEKLPFDFEISNKATIKKINETYDFIIIDTPPNNTDIIDEAVKVADIVILPTTPSNIDLSRVVQSVDKLEDKKYRVLITIADIRTVAFSSLKPLLRENEIDYLDNYVRTNETIRNSYNMIPTEKEYYDYENVAKEIMGVL